MLRMTDKQFEEFKRFKDIEVFTEAQIKAAFGNTVIQKSSFDELSDEEKDIFKSNVDELASFAPIEVLSPQPEGSLEKGSISNILFVRESQVEFIEEDIVKSIDGVDEIEKARAGVYKDTAHNRKMGRVGQKFGAEKKGEDGEGDDLVGKTVSIGTNGTKFKIKKVEDGEATLEALEDIPGGYSKEQVVKVSRLKEFGTFGLMKDSSEPQKKDGEKKELPEHVNKFLQKVSKTVIDNRDNSPYKIPSGSMNSGAETFAENNGLTIGEVTNLMNEGILKVGFENRGNDGFTVITFNPNKLKQFTNK